MFPLLKLPSSADFAMDTSVPITISNTYDFNRHTYQYCLTKLLKWVGSIVAATKHNLKAGDW